MSRENPFDWVKDLNQSVEFVAESYDAKEFKKGVSTLLDTDASPGSLVHCIVGDYGSGKSHINHHVFESAKKTENILNWKHKTEILEWVKKFSETQND